jgi:hypothetical protein
MARQAGEEGRIAPLEGVCSAVSGIAGGDTQMRSSPSQLLHTCAEIQLIPVSRLIFISRDIYPVSLDDVVGGFCVEA